MDILLINPPSPHIETNSVVGIKVPPLGLAYLAAVLEEKGHVVRIIDAHALDMSINHVAEEIDKAQPRVVGVTSTTPTNNEALSIVKATKEVCPDAFTVMGGPHVSFLPKETLRENEDLDAVVIGEGEKTILSLSKAIEKKESFSNIQGIAYRNKQIITRNPPRPLIRNLDELPFPARHLLPMDRYTILGKKATIAHLLSSRGCPFHCVFCASSLLFGKRFRGRSPKNVVDEMEEVVSKYSPVSIEFADDEFTLDLKRTEGICDEILERGLDTPWACSSRVDTISRPILKKMKRAGCTLIFYGIESGSQRMLDYMKKGTTLEQIEKAVKWTKQAGIETYGSFILGFPDETKEEMRQTIEFAKKLRLDYAQFSIATPYPGTEFYDEIEEEDMLQTKDWSKFTAGKPVFEGRTWTRNELQKIFTMAYIRFYLSPRIFIKNLHRIGLKESLQILKSAIKTIDRGGRAEWKG